MDSSKLKIFLTIVLLFAVLFFIPNASAHVVVKPDQVGIASFQTFSVNVPNEKNSPVTSLRLIIPEGLQYVTPNVKPGWNIDIKKNTEGDNAVVSEIEWKDGVIPAGQRDEFVFSAQVPSKETVLSWKAYQTYQNGDQIAWDQDPLNMKNMSDEDKEKLEKQGKGPLSQTKIINDVSKEDKISGSAQTSNSSIGLSLIAIGLAAVSLTMQLRRR